jgi:hypothetical protein
LGVLQLTNDSTPTTPIGSIFLSITSLGLIIIGATGIFDLNLANVGRLLVFGFGVFLLSLSIELRHKISELLDSNLSDRPGMETRYRENRMIISIIMWLIICLSFMLSLLALSSRKFEQFTLMLTCFTVLLGVVLARHFGGAKFTDGFSQAVNQEHKNREYQQLKYWLDGDSSTVISAVQLDHIQRQRDLFEQETERVIDDPHVFKATLTTLEEFLEDTVDEPDDFIELLWNKEFKSVHTDWLTGAVEYVKQGRIRQMRELLGRLLTLPVLIKLLQAISSPQTVELDWELGRKSNLFRNLLKQCERSVKLLQGYGFTSYSPDERVGMLFSNNPQYDEFVLFLAYNSSRWDQYEFSPWWLLRSRLLIDLAAPLEKKSDSAYLNSPLKRHIPSAAEDFEEWCFCVSEYLSDKTSINYDSAIVDTTQQILQLRTMTFDQDLILVSWWAYQRLS